MRSGSGHCGTELPCHCIGNTRTAPGGNALRSRIGQRGRQSDGRRAGIQAQCVHRLNVYGQGIAGKSGASEGIAEYRRTWPGGGGLQYYTHACPNGQARKLRGGIVHKGGCRSAQHLHGIRLAGHSGPLYLHAVAGHDAAKWLRRTQRILNPYRAGSAALTIGRSYCVNQSVQSGRQQRGVQLCGGLSVQCPGAAGSRAGQ